tara:strand:+ start:5592 stop:5789 length:198 start_codon:yes stop_codon:yes gene_type:complete
MTLYLGLYTKVQKNIRCLEVLGNIWTYTKNKKKRNGNYFVMGGLILFAHIRFFRLFVNGVLVLVG